MRAIVEQFSDVKYITTRVEAAHWLTRYCHARGLRQFQLRIGGSTIEGSSESPEAAPMRAEIRSLFAELSQPGPGSVASRMSGSALPFWVAAGSSTGFPGMREAGPSGHVLCCPLRYGAAEHGVGLFFAREPCLESDETALLQARLVQLVERLVEVGEVSAPGHDAVSDDLHPDDIRCLSLIASGKDIGRITSELGLDDHSFNARLAIARNRLGGRNLAHAIAIAIRNGVI